MKIIDKITITELYELSKKLNGMVKMVIDIKKNIIMIDAPMHADMATYLTQNGSEFNDLWGIRIFPNASGNEYSIKFISMINDKSTLNNSQYIKDKNIKNIILDILKAAIINAESLI